MPYSLLLNGSDLFHSWTLDLQYPCSLWTKAMQNVVFDYDYCDAYVSIFWCVRVGTFCRQLRSLLLPYQIGLETKPIFIWPHTKVCDLFHTFQWHRKSMGLSEVDSKVRYVQRARSLKTYGVTFFLVKEKMKGKNKLVPRLLGITKESVMRLDERTKEIIKVISSA